MPTNILAIESSCDETAVALCVDGACVQEEVASQAIHATYGGVVPELASRAHLVHIIPTVDAVLRKARMVPSQLTHLAVTQGPGLIGSLLVGNTFTQGLALAWGLPTIPVHHLKAHLFASYLKPPTPQGPFLGLIVSGGHTQLLRVEGYEKMVLLGETVDDAVGEAFDKIAKLLGFPYPGGAHIDQHAEGGDPHAFAFPVTHMPRLNFSFSGVKTAVRYFLHKRRSKEPDFISTHLKDLCASVQHTLVTMLIKQIARALTQTGSSELVVGGGVACNRELVRRLHALAEARGINLYVPEARYCQDNAAMVGIAAYHRLQEGFQPSTSISMPALSRMSL